VQERLDVNAGGALVQASSKEDELILGVRPEAVVFERIPALMEKLIELPLSGRLPPLTPLTELHVGSIAR